MTDPLQRGLRGLAHAQGEAAQATLAQLTSALEAVWSPFRAGLPQVLASAKTGDTDELPEVERRALTGRALARTLEQASTPVLESLVATTGAQLAAEASRWERLAETVDLLSPQVGGATLLARVRAANVRYSQLGASAANPGVAARHHATLQAFADALGVHAAAGMLRTAAAADRDALLSDALALLLEGEAARAALARLTAGLLAPLLDVIDHHLSSLSGT